MNTHVDEGAPNDSPLRKLAVEARGIKDAAQVMADEFGDLDALDEDSINFGYACGVRDVIEHLVERAERTYALNALIEGPQDEEEDVRGCSCGMADYGAPGHDGHDETVTVSVTCGRCGDTFHVESNLPTTNHFHEKREATGEYCGGFGRVAP